MDTHDDTARKSDALTVFEFRTYLDKMQSHCKARIDRANNEEKAARERGEKLSLGAHIARGNSHELLRDIKVGYELLDAFEQSIRQTATT